MPAIDDAGCRQHRRVRLDRSRTLFPESRRYDEGSLAAASSHVAGPHADPGGTGILPALKNALDQPPGGTLAAPDRRPHRPRGRGYDAVYRSWTHAAQARVFSFGLGAGSAVTSSTAWRERAEGGGVEPPGERIEPKVVRVFGRLLPRR